MAATNYDSSMIPMEGCPHSGLVDFTKSLEFTALKNKTVLITGGASGIGAACAELWASKGANVIIGDINAGLGERLVASLRASSNNQDHHFLPLNVTNWQSQVTFFKRAAQLSPHGGIDVVVANAGISGAVEAAAFEDPPDYSQLDNPPEPSCMLTIDINLRGVFYTTNLALSYLPRNPGSLPCEPNQTPQARDRQIILVSSIAGLAPLPKFAPYCATKHGVVGLFRALRATAPRDHGIRVNMINPYFIKTAILGVVGSAMMAGGDTAELDDVVHVLTRFVTDQSIIGRGIAVGPRGSTAEAKAVGLPHGGSAWDVYAHDFEQSDLFVRRLIGLTNVRVKVKGSIGMITDLFWAFATPVTTMMFGKAKTKST